MYRTALIRSWRRLNASISINLRTRASLFFERLITPSKTSPCRGRWGKIPMFSSGSRANPFSQRFRSNIAHRPDLRISRDAGILGLGNQTLHLNLIVKLTPKRERGIGYETQDHRFTDQHSVDESVATILERLLPRLREYGANE